MSNRTVQVEIVKAWRRQFPNDELHVAVPIVHPPVIEGIQFHRTRLRRHPFINRLELPRLAKALEVDHVVCHNFGAGGRSTTLVHDLIFVDHPEWFTWSERLYLALIRPSLRGSQIVTTSETELERVKRLVPQVRALAAIGMGTPTDLFEAPQIPKHLDADRLVGFVLSVGRLNERKNLETVIRACASTRSISARRPLIVVGVVDGKGRSLSMVAPEMLSDGSLISLDSLSGGELRWLYENGDALIMASLDEGYGMPAREARDFGLPRILSDIAIMREVGGSDALFFSSSDVAGLVRLIDEIEPRGEIEHRPVELPSWDTVVRRLRSVLV